MSRGVVPHFQSVKVEAQVSTFASMTDLEKVVEETEARCPVYNLIKDAGVKVLKQSGYVKQVRFDAN